MLLEYDIICHYYAICNIFSVCGTKNKCLRTFGRILGKSFSFRQAPEFQTERQLSNEFLLWAYNIHYVYPTGSSKGFSVLCRNIGLYVSLQLLPIYLRMMVSFNTHRITRCLKSFYHLLYSPILVLFNLSLFLMVNSFRIALC
jgi:hypothetical protein